MLFEEIENCEDVDDEKNKFGGSDDCDISELSFKIGILAEQHKQ